MTEFVNMWKNYVNFGARTTVRGYWMAFLFHFIVLVVLAIISTIASSLSFLYYLYALAALVPALAMAVRRLRDAGKAWTNIFWAFLPLVGTIILIVLLVKPSVPEDGVPVV